jgi:hypothetical protein
MKRRRLTQGYGYEHRQLRKAVAVKVAAGNVECWRCHCLISPFEKWELGHDDWNRSLYRGPEHRTCNRRAAGQKTQLLKKARRQVVSRSW